MKKGLEISHPGTDVKLNRFKLLFCNFTSPLHNRVRVEVNDIRNLKDGYQGAFLYKRFL